MTGKEPLEEAGHLIATAVELERRGTALRNEATELYRQADELRERARALMKRS